MRIYGPESRYGRRLRWWERWLWQLGRELKKTEPSTAATGAAHRNKAKTGVLASDYNTMEVLNDNTQMSRFFEEKEQMVV